MKDLKQAEDTAAFCLVGCPGPHETADIFWLMGWADWAIEAQMIREENA